jgi:peptidoglycan biosynthesis protein MviN/MurJ (putative lipid II flippase)
MLIYHAAFGIAYSGRQLRNYVLSAISGTLLGICMLELIFLARYNTHPVEPWVWVVLQLAATLLLIVGLYIIAEKLEQKKEAL